jgi:hypothetical protein
MVGIPEIDANPSQSLGTQEEATHALIITLKQFKLTLKS